MSFLWDRQWPRQGHARHLMLLYDSYSKLPRSSFTTPFLPYLTPQIIYDIMTRISLLHEPIFQYPAQERWALRLRFSYDGHV